MTKITKGYKAFEFDWTCRGKNYGGPGKVTEEKGRIAICDKGIHACLKLKDVIKYYPLLQSYKFAEIEAYGEVEKSTDDSKFCASKIKIIKEISFNEALAILTKEAAEEPSKGVSSSDGVSYSDGVISSKGVSYSDGVSHSKGVISSKGVSSSYGILNCKGISTAIFCMNLPKKFLLFNKEISEKRYHEVLEKIEKLNKGWIPTPTNTKELYLMVSSDWKKVPLYRIKEKTQAEMWADMPAATVEYIKSLPEFDAQIFKQITGK